MVSAFDPGALLSRLYALPSGPRVRLRLVQRRDEPAIRALLGQAGREPEDLEVTRLLRFDPRRRVVMCATALVGSAEKVVGLGAIDLNGRPDARPDVLLVDSHSPPALSELLDGALRGRARAIAHVRAA